MFATPTDSGLYQVVALPELSELPRFRRSLEESYLEYVRRCDPVAQALSGARRVGKLFGMLRWEGFFREATGPGWVLAVDNGKAGLLPAVLPEIAQRLLKQGKQDSFTDLFNHRSTPSKVITPARILAATGRLLARGGCDRRALLREVGGLVAQDTQRKRLARHPQYVPLEASADAGATEVESGDAAVLR